MGVKIDRDLSWRMHIDHLHRQCMAVIRRASRYLPQNVRRLLYQAFVLPHVDYCSIRYGTTVIRRASRHLPQNCHVERLCEKDTKYALRIIYGKPPRASHC